MQSEKCTECEKSDVYAEGEKLCNDCWYTANFESED